MQITMNDWKFSQTFLYQGACQSEFYIFTLTVSLHLKAAMDP